MYTPTQEIIKTIFGSILNAHFVSYLDPKVHKLSEPLVDSTINLFQLILKATQLSPSAKRFHY
jgi:dynein heavy chain